MSKCVACGQYIEQVMGSVTLPSGRTYQTTFDNHHCPERFENMRQGVDRREREHYERSPNFATRLSVGFKALSEFGDF
jgi:hypothetical protein